LTDDNIKCVKMHTS